MESTNLSSLGHFRIRYAFSCLDATSIRLGPPQPGGPEIVACRVGGKVVSVESSSPIESVIPTF